MSAQSTAEEVRQSDTLDHGVRLGLVVYGIVHVIVAGIALQMAWGSGGGEEASQQGAFSVLADSPLGRSVLYIVALGLAALVLWQLSEAAVGHREADGKERIAKRLTSVGKAAVYAVLATAHGHRDGAPARGGVRRLRWGRDGADRRGSGVAGLPSPPPAHRQEVVPACEAAHTMSWCLASSR